MSIITVPTMIMTRKRVSYQSSSPSQIHTPIGVIGAPNADEQPNAARSCVLIGHRATRHRAA